jgi:hypothetical protein
LAPPGWSFDVRKGQILSAVETAMANHEKSVEENLPGEARPDATASCSTN